MKMDLSNIITELNKQGNAFQEVLRGNQANLEKALQTMQGDNEAVKKAAQDRMAEEVKFQEDINKQGQTVQTAADMRGQQVEMARQFKESRDNFNSAAGFLNKKVEGPLDVVKAIVLGPLMKIEANRAAQNMQSIGVQSDTLAKIIANTYAELSISPPTSLAQARGQENIAEVNLKANKSFLEATTMRNQAAAQTAQVGVDIVKSKLEGAHLINQEARQAEDAKFRREEFDFRKQEHEDTVEYHKLQMEKSQLELGQYKKTLGAKNDFAQELVRAFPTLTTSAAERLSTDEKVFYAYTTIKNNALGAKEIMEQAKIDPAMATIRALMLNGSVSAPINGSLAEGIENSMIGKDMMGQPVKGIKNVDMNRVTDFTYIENPTANAKDQKHTIMVHDAFDGKEKSAPQYLMDRYYGPNIYGLNNDAVKNVVETNPQFAQIMNNPQMIAGMKTLAEIKGKQLTPADFMGLVDNKVMDGQTLFQMLVGLGNGFNQNIPWTALGVNPHFTKPLIPWVRRIPHVNRITGKITVGEETVLLESIDQIAELQQPVPEISDASLRGLLSKSTQNKLDEVGNIKLIPSPQDYVQ